MAILSYCYCCSAPFGTASGLDSEFIFSLIRKYISEKYLQLKSVFRADKMAENGKYSSNINNGQSINPNDQLKINQEGVIVGRDKIS